MTAHFHRLPKGLIGRFALAAMAALIAVGLSACGSTKVYTADKTLVYDGALYNLSSVKAFSSEVRGQSASGESLSLRGTDKRGWNDLVDKHGAIRVETVIMMDDRELLYERRNISKWSDFDRMRKKLESASKDITKFMADKKKTQLKLK